MSKCAHNRCSNVGPFGSRWYKGRQEWVPYKLCSDCRERNASNYKKFGAAVRSKNKLPEVRHRIHKNANKPEQKARNAVAQKAYRNSAHGKAVVSALAKKRTLAIASCPALRLELTITASIRGRLRGARHGHSVNLENYTDFKSHEDIIAHFQSVLKPGMTLTNYGSFWSVAHKIPKVYYDFSDPEEVRRCNSKANFGCDYEVADNPLSERTNSAKGGAMPSLAEIQSVDPSCWPALFGGEMTESKRKRLWKHRERLMHAECV